MKIYPEQTWFDAIVHEFGGVGSFALFVVPLLLVIALVVVLVIRECRRPGRPES